MNNRKNKARRTERDAVKLLLQCRLVRNVMAFCSFTQGPGTNASQEEAPGTIGLPEEGAHTNKKWPAYLKTDINLCIPHKQEHIYW